MSGNTKREPPISWRPSPAASVALADVMQRMPKLKRNEVLNLIVIKASQQGRDINTPAERLGIDPEADQELAQAGKRLAHWSGRNPEDEGVTKRDDMADAQARREHEQQLRMVKRQYGGIDRNKLAAFQRKTGMDSAKNKR